jgi:hypothetical protein
LRDLLFKYPILSSKVINLTLLLVSNTSQEMKSNHNEVTQIPHGTAENGDRAFPTPYLSHPWINLQLAVTF